MKYKLIFGALAIVVCCLVARCTQQGWSLRGHTAFNEYTYALLLDEDGHRVDSVAICKGDFAISLADNAGNPRIMTVRLMNARGADNSFDMPVVVENGTVNLSIGDYVLVGGTTLNDDLQEFFNDLQACQDKCLRTVGMSEPEITGTFSAFYLQQITLHRNDVLGPYIYRNYGIHLDAGANREARKLLNLK